MSLQEEKIRTQTHTEGRLCEERRKDSICKPGKGVSEEANLSDILISDFWPPDL